MTTYTLVPSSQTSLRSVAWGDPTIWSGGVVPNDPSADVVIPAPPAGADGSDIEVSSAYTINSLSLADILDINQGSLTVARAVNVAGGQIQLDGTSGAASLTAGSVTNDGWIQGQGTITCSGAFLNEAGRTIVGSGLSITAGSFDNAGLLATGSGSLTLTTKPGGFSNLSGSTLTGAYTAGIPYAASGAARIFQIFLNVGSVVTADAGSITLFNGGDIESYDAAKSAYVPIEATMQNIAPTGTLTLSPGVADSWGKLAVDGLLHLESANLTTAQLSVDPGGMVVGDGSISGPVVDNGMIIAGDLSTYVSSSEHPATGATLDITGAISGAGTLKIAPTISNAIGATSQSNPSTVELSAAASVKVAFTDGTGTLILGDPSAFTGSITPAAAGDKIQLAGIALSSVTADSYTAGQNGGVLTIDLSGGSQIDLHVALGGDQTFSLSAGPQATTSDPPSLLITYDGSATPTPAPDLFRDHFNGPGISDVLIENTIGSVVAGQIADGRLAYTQISGLGVPVPNGSLPFASFTGPWTIGGTGDFLGDGRSAFVIENASGVLVVAEANNYDNEVGTLGLEWRFTGTGDFLGPNQGVTANNVGGGQDQFLIENTAGDLALGTVVKVAGATPGIDLLWTTVYSAIGGLGPEWTIVGTGAYLGDGQSQFLIENTNGAVDVGEVTGGATSVRYTQVAALGPEWKFVESGDFLDDGKAQFLIENTAGALAIGEVGSNNAVQYTAITGLGPEWKFVGAGDYLDKGYEQFAIESTSGAVFIGDYTGGHVRFTLVGALGPEWSFHG